MRVQDREWLDKLQRQYNKCIRLLKEWDTLDKRSVDRQAVRAAYQRYADTKLGPLDEVAYTFLKIRAELDPLLEAHPLTDINPLLEPDKYEPAAKNKFQVAMELSNMAGNLETEIDIILGALHDGLSQDYLPWLMRKCLHIGARLMLIDLLTGRKDRWETQICYETGGLMTVSTMESLQKAFDSHYSRMGWAKAWRDKEESARPTYEEACSVADKLWSEGDKALDWKMARVLCATTEFTKLSKKQLKRYLEPIAEKYGKRSGYKNGKKIQ